MSLFTDNDLSINVALPIVVGLWLKDWLQTLIIWGGDSMTFMVPTRTLVCPLLQRQSQTNE